MSLLKIKLKFKLKIKFVWVYDGFSFIYDIYSHDHMSTRGTGNQNGVRSFFARFTDGWRNNSASVTVGFQRVNGFPSTSRSNKDLIASAT